MKLVGERRAIAAIILAFWFLNFLMIALTGQAGELSKAIAALAGCYGLAFLGVVAGYFWARWYAVGIGLFGVIVAGVAMWKEGMAFEFQLLGGLHAAIALCLWGSAMSGPFDGQSAWRDRYHMDEHAVQRLGRSVIRAGASLPFILMYAFMPKGAAMSIGSVGALALAGIGFSALVQLRTWGVLALAAAGAMTLSLGAADTLAHGATVFSLAPIAAGALLAAAAAPFAVPMLSYLRRR